MLPGVFSIDAGLPEALSGAAGPLCPMAVRGLFSRPGPGAPPPAGQSSPRPLCPHSCPGAMLGLHTPGPLALRLPCAAAGDNAQGRGGREPRTGTTCPLPEAGRGLAALCLHGTPFPQAPEVGQPFREGTWLSRSSGAWACELWPASLRAAVVIVHGHCSPGIAGGPLTSPAGPGDITEGPRKDGAAPGCSVHSGVCRIPVLMQCNVSSQDPSERVRLEWSGRFKSRS